MKTTFAALCLVLALSALTANANPSNDVTLYTRALFQDCEDSNQDTLAVKFLEGTERWIASHKSTRDVARGALQKVSDHNVVYFSSRTNYIDNNILTWTAQDPSIKQIVLVAAGFDSRPYRLNLPNVKFFEVDFPSVVEKKQQKVAENSLSVTGKSVTYVGADLRNTTLQAALEGTKTFDKNAKTIYVVEGLVYYLHQDALDKLFYSIGQVAAIGSKTILDFTNDCLFTVDCPNLNPALIRIFLTIVKAKNEPWYSGFPPGAVAPWLKRWGFATEELLSFQNAGEPPLNVKTWTNSTIFGQMNFVTAEKVRAVRSYEEYLLV